MWPWARTGGLVFARQNCPESLWDLAAAKFKLRRRGEPVPGPEGRASHGMAEADFCLFDVPTSVAVTLRAELQARPTTQDMTECVTFHVPPPARLSPGGLPRCAPSAPHVTERADPK